MRITTHNGNTPVTVGTGSEPRCCHEKVLAWKAENALFCSPVRRQWIAASYREVRSSGRRAGLLVDSAASGDNGVRMPE